MQVAIGIGASSFAGLIARRLSANERRNGQHCTVHTVRVVNQLPAPGELQSQVSIRQRSRLHLVICDDIAEDVRCTRQTSEHEVQVWGIDDTVPGLHFYASLVDNEDGPRFTLHAGAEGGISSASILYDWGP